MVLESRLRLLKTLRLRWLNFVRLPLNTHTLRGKGIDRSSTGVLVINVSGRILEKILMNCWLWFVNGLGSCIRFSSLPLWFKPHAVIWTPREAASCYRVEWLAPGWLAGLLSAFRGFVCHNRAHE